MSQIAATMPEAKFRSTKKRVQPVRSTPPSHRTHSSIAVASANMEVAVKAVESAKAVEAIKPAKKEKSKSSRKPGEAIASWWPVAVALFLSGFAPEWHTMTVHAGIWFERAIFPLTLLAQHREIGIDDQMATALPQLAIYLQLPLEGLLTKITLDRGKSLKAAVMQLVLVHAVCVFVLWLLTTNLR